jgi:hypothetical protein
MNHTTLFAELTNKYVTSRSWEFCMTTRHTSHFSLRKMTPSATGNEIKQRGHYWASKFLHVSVYLAVHYSVVTLGFPAAMAFHIRGAFRIRHHSTTKQNKTQTPHISKCVLYSFSYLPDLDVDWEHTRWEAIHTRQPGITRTLLAFKTQGKAFQTKAADLNEICILWHVLTFVYWGVLEQKDIKHYWASYKLRFTCKLHGRYETKLKSTNSVFSDIPSCSAVKIGEHFGGTYHLHL